MLTKTQTKMHGVRGARYERFLGVDCCISDDEYYHFVRTEWRLGWLLVWRHDSPKEQRPLTELVHRAFG